MLRDLTRKSRSYRRFWQEVAVEHQTLRELVDLARLSPSAGNMQPLKYILSCDPKKNDLVFQNLVWARYIENWLGPPEGERPSAYIMILEDKNVEHPLRCDHGIAAQSILLGATEKDLGGCIVGAINKPNLRKVLKGAQRANKPYLICEYGYTEHAEHIPIIFDQMPVREMVGHVWYNWINFDERIKGKISNPRLFNAFKAMVGRLERIKADQLQPEREKNA